MASAELTLFSYEILGLVGRGGAGPHDLLLLAKRGRFFNWRARASTTPSQNGWRSSAT
jgi:hypothetical protein